MEAPFEQPMVGSELRSHLVAFGERGALSARLNARAGQEARVRIDLDAQTIDLTEVAVETA